uniref:Uncharacterized protein n=3 Tax=Myotis myotis TaxID=51298 RepID=A0A7J7YGH1_MYOMY|nr:hypothetical protein mMyoMyo1_020371 [Myotis myotis]
MFLTFSGIWGHRRGAWKLLSARALSAPTFYSFTGSAPHWSAWSSLLSAQLLLSLRNHSFTTGARTGPGREVFAGAQGAAAKAPLARRTMLRGKSRLNVEWLGYSPGLLLDQGAPPPGRTPRNPGR